METEDAGEEGVRGSNVDATVKKKGPVLMNPPARRPPRLLAQELARGPAIALTTLGPQERKAPHRPPIPPPLTQRQAPRSPSPAPT